MEKQRSRARELADEAARRGEPLGWFETLYSEAQGEAGLIPWADERPNPNLVSWLKRRSITPGGRALVVGCGLGDDAEYLAADGFAVTAFDISASAVAWCRSRFPNSNVVYEVHDLLQPATAWHRAFDFIFESYTLQVLPPALRRLAMRHIADWVSTNGTLLVVTRGREPHESPGQMPWPLSRDELSVFEESGLVCRQFEDYLEDESPPVRRFRVTYGRKNADPRNRSNVLMPE